MDRRQLLSRLPLIPTAVAAIAGGASSVAGHELSELMRLFGAWDGCDRAAWDVETDEQSDAIYERMRQLEAAIMEIPAETAAEFAAKVVVATSYGDWLPSREFVAEAARLCGASRSSGFVEPAL